MATNGFEYGGLRIQAVENGSIISNGSERFVFTNLKCAIKLIEESFKE